MHLDAAACHRAARARDARYDGRFFTCVKTTGIYCRPICPARHAKFENCIYLPTAAAAQEAGFRPCLRCRPESSPDLDAWRGTSATVSRALKLIEAGALDAGDVAALADRLAIGERHLRRLFHRHIGAAPVTVAQTRRVLLAKQLIHQTGLNMTQVALASGFGSVRRFNETFQHLYQRPPGELRRRAATRPSSSLAPGLSLLLPYRAPYDWEAMMQFLARRAITGLEVVTPARYTRVIELGGTPGTIAVTHVPAKSSLRVVVRFPRLNALPTIITRLRRMFDLSADPGAIASVLALDPVLAPLVAARPGLRVPGGWDGFEIAVRAVLGQQVTVRVATRLVGQLVAAAGQPVAGLDAEGLSHAFPRPERLDRRALDGVGIPLSRAAALIGLAAAARNDARLFDPRSDLSAAVMRLKELPGVGEWTAQYIAMRALGESDAFPAGDAAVRTALMNRGHRLTPGELLARASAWSPWRAYAVLHLWMAEAPTIGTSNRKRRHAIAT